MINFEISHTGRHCNQLLGTLLHNHIHIQYGKQSFMTLCICSLFPNMAARKRKHNCYEFEGYLINRAHRNKIPMATPMFFRVELFNENNIYVVGCRRHTGNRYGS